MTNSTHALIIYKYKYKLEDGTELLIDIWDTAGQEMFNNIHPTYFFEAHAALLVKIIKFNPKINLKGI